MSRRRPRPQPPHRPTGGAVVRPRVAAPTPDVYGQARAALTIVADGTRALVGAAARFYAGATAKMTRKSTDLSWQAEVSEMYASIGELRYVANSVANAGALATLYVSRRNPEDGTWDRVEDGDDPGVQALAKLTGDSPVGQTELLRRHGLHLFLFGESWLVGHPKVDDDRPPIDTENPPDPADGLTPYGDAVDADGSLDLDAMQWGAYSPLEVKEDAGGLRVAGVLHPIAKCTAIRVWRPHPALTSEADSPCRSILPVLRLIVGLTRRVGAELDSRFGGRGLLVVPKSLTVLGAQPPEEDGVADSIVDWILEAITTAIKDPESAAAVCPIVIEVPDEIAAQDLIKHITFDSSFDERTQGLTDLMIRRMALGLDAPPERLLGMGDSTHWNAWIVGADEVKLNISPWLAVIRDAWTRKYLRPVLRELAEVDVDPLDYSIDADLSELTVQPDRADDALRYKEALLISDDAAREAGGFAPDDAPVDDPRAEALRRALDMVTQAPSLAETIGIAVLVDQIEAVLRRTDAVEADTDPAAETVDTQEPDVVEGDEAA